MNHPFDVAGMTCGHCVKAVQRAVLEIDAQAKVSVDLATGRVEIESAQSREALAAAIADAGYSVQ